MNRSETVRPVRESLEEYGRGVAGGLLFSLPLLYTMEVWWAGFLIEPATLLLYMGMTFLLLLGYNRFAGMRKDASFVEVIFDSIEEMGIGLIVAALVLYLLGRITAEMPPSEVLGKIIVEAMTVAIGVSVGTSQLGGPGISDTGTAGSEGPGGPGRNEAPTQPDTWAQLVLGFCGAVLFAANVAPTEEILVIGIETPPWKLIGLLFLSLLVGAVILFYSAFYGAEKNVHRNGALWMAFSLVSSYSSALAASALILWFFQRLDGVSPAVALSQIVVLAFPAMLGASAGRLLIQ